MTVKFSQYAAGETRPSLAKVKPHPLTNYKHICICICIVCITYICVSVIVAVLMDGFYRQSSHKLCAPPAASLCPASLCLVKLLRTA